MTMLQLLRLSRSRLPLIAAVFAVSLLFGALTFFPQRKVYEVSILVENQNWAPYRAAHPSLTIRQALETGVLDEKIALRAGPAGQKPLPKFEAGYVGFTEVLKIFASVPAEEIDRTKMILNAMFGVLKDDFRRDDSGRLRAVKLPCSPDIRLVSPPAAAELPAGPSKTQALLAFGLLGFFGGLAAALWSAEREAARNKGPLS